MVPSPKGDDEAIKSDDSARRSQDDPHRGLVLFATNQLLVSARWVVDNFEGTNDNAVRPVREQQFGDREIPCVSGLFLVCCWPRWLSPAC
jgi:hypothetical protein